MGFFRWLQTILAGGGNRPRPVARPVKPPVGQCGEIADRLHRCADRFANAGDEEAEREARNAAEAVERMTNAEAAKRREVAFYRSRGLMDDGRPQRPKVGTAGGNEYVRYGSTVRSGGSKGWRYNNPGYVRCSERATYYGAVGCDGEYAIFPDEHTGRRAYIQQLREEHSDRTVDDVVREQLPPAEAQSFLASLGTQATSRVGDLNEADFHSAAAAGLSSVESGVTFDRDASESPAWSDDVWDSPADQGSNDSHTDNS